MPKTNGERQIRVIVSANPAVSRAGLESIVRNSALLQLAGSFAGWSNLASHLRELQADVVLVDLNPDELGLVERLPGLGSPDSSIPIVVLMDQAEGAWIVRALRRGVRAILARNASSDEIIWAIQAANSGLFLFNDDAARQITARFGPGPPAERTELVEELTEREIEILRKLAERFGE